MDAQEGIRPVDGTTMALEEKVPSSARATFNVVGLWVGALVVGSWIGVFEDNPVSFLPPLLASSGEEGTKEG